jgi:hypothetical protein
VRDHRAGRRACVEAQVERDERRLGEVEPLEQVAEVDDRAGEAVELGDDQAVAAACAAMPAPLSACSSVETRT